MRVTLWLPKIGTFNKTELLHGFFLSFSTTKNYLLIKNHKQSIDILFLIF